MDVNLINPFINGVVQTLPMLGIQQVQRGKLSVKSDLTASQDVAVLVGFTRGLKGNIIYGMSEQVARNIASVMMMGMPVDEFNEMAQSAISEMANMVAANAAIALEGTGQIVDITPPTLIVGHDITARISSVKTIAVEIESEAGIIEVNIGLEA